MEENLLKDVELAMVGKITPHEAADHKVKLAGYYSFYAGQLEDILVKKPQVWNDMRKNFKSDKATERAWQATQDGINEVGLGLRMKRIEKMMSALSSLIKVAEGESRNQW